MSNVETVEIAGLPRPVETDKKYFLALFFGNWVFNEGWSGYIVSKKNFIFLTVNMKPIIYQFIKIIRK